MTTFCPYCNEDIGGDVHEWWSFDYPIMFTFECPKCNKEIEVEVEATPTFVCYKKSNKQINSDPK